MREGRARASTRLRSRPASCTCSASTPSSCRCGSSTSGRDVSSARAPVLEAPRTLVARDFAVPEIGDDDALLRVEACGLCGTDHEEYTGQLFPGYAFVPGHESVGVLEAVGDTAARRWNVRAGQRVAVEVFLSCGVCE